MELDNCLICDSKSARIMMYGKHVNNIYMLDIDHAYTKIEQYLI